MKFFLEFAKMGVLFRVLILEYFLGLYCFSAFMRLSGNWIFGCFLGNRVCKYLIINDDYL
ncbi:MAG: hypothetical protein II956_17005 [Bacteroidales bacterium]|nr:hypothetical protein [Bacteroidales bacterium]